MIKINIISLILYLLLSFSANSENLNKKETDILNIMINTEEASIAILSDENLRKFKNIDLEKCINSKGDKINYIKHYNELYELSF